MTSTKEQLSSHATTDLSSRAPITKHTEPQVFSLVTLKILQFRASEGPSLARMLPVVNSTHIVRMTPWLWWSLYTRGIGLVYAISLGSLYHQLLALDKIFPTSVLLDRVAKDNPDK